MSGVAELQDAARRAVEAATSAGASDAEAWSEGSRSREVRVHAGEVESLTEASGRGVGIRAWIGTAACSVRSSATSSCCAPPSR